METEGARIIDAHIDVYLDSTPESRPDVEIYIEDSRSPAPFSEGNNVTNRPRAPQSIEWSETPLGQGWHSTPTLTGLLGPLLESLSGPGNGHVAFVWRGGPNAAADFEIRGYGHSDGLYPPTLVVNYALP